MDANDEFWFIVALMFLILIAVTGCAYQPPGGGLWMAPI